MKHLLILGAAAALGSSPAAALAAETPVDVLSPIPGSLGSPGARLTLVDADGRVVGELVSEGADRLRLRLIRRTGAAPAGLPTIGRSTTPGFRPDYARALTPGQMSAAWQAEIDRLMPPVLAGGG